MSIVLSFRVKKQKLKRLDRQQLVNKSSKVLKCLFEFKGMEWEDNYKFAVFTNDQGESSTVKLSDGLKSECLIPDVATEGKYFTVSVYGGDSNLITTNGIQVLLVPSPYPRHRDHGNSCCSSDRDIYIDIFDRLSNCITNIEFEDGVLKCFNSKGLLLQEVELNPEEDEDLEEMD